MNNRSGLDYYGPCPECRKNGRDTRGDNLAHYKDGSAHCFACQYHEYGTVYSQFLAKKDEPNGTKSSAALPSDFTREIPAIAWKWLLQYGLPYTYWEKYCGYSPKEGRLVFTVGEPVAFSTGRLIEPEKQSGENHGKRRKWYVWGQSHRHCEAISPPGPVKNLVIVEDIVSAHKVGQVATAVPLFGTEFHPAHIYYLFNSHLPVTLWLDKDQESLIYKKAMHLGSIISKQVQILVTDQDPKSIEMSKLKEMFA